MRLRPLIRVRNMTNTCLGKRQSICSDKRSKQHTRIEDGQKMWFTAWRPLQIFITFRRLLLVFFFYFSLYLPVFAFSRGGASPRCP